MTVTAGFSAMFLSRLSAVTGRRFGFSSMGDVERVAQNREADRHDVRDCMPVSGSKVRDALARQEPAFPIRQHASPRALRSAAAPPRTVAARFQSAVKNQVTAAGSSWTLLVPDGSLLPQSAKRWPGFCHKPRNQNQRMIIEQYQSCLSASW